MRTFEDTDLGLVYTDYTEEESESLFGEMKQKIFEIPEGYDGPLPQGYLPTRVFRDFAWPVIVLTDDYETLKRDAYSDGSPATHEELVEHYGEHHESYYRDEITPFLDVLEARGTTKIIRWAMHGSGCAAELPIQPYIAQLWPKKTIKLDDPVTGWWLLHDEFCDWGIYSDCENHGYLGGSLPLMKKYIDRMGGWATYRDCVDREFEARADSGDSYWNLGVVYEIYYLARWSFPFSTDPLRPERPDYEPYEPLAD